MTYNRKIILKEQRKRLDKELLSALGRAYKIQEIIMNPRDPVDAIFGHLPVDDGTEESPLVPMAGTYTVDCVKVAIALANERGSTQWIKFNDLTFYVKEGEDLVDVARRVEYLRNFIYIGEDNDT